MALAYELHVANFRDIDVTLAQLEVLPVRDLAHPLARFTGQDLWRRVRRPGKPANFVHPERIGGGEFAVVFLWLTLPSGQSIPQAIAHRKMAAKARFLDQRRAP